MRSPRIENKVAELHRELWRSQDSLWPAGRPSLIDMLDPFVACHVLGVKYEEFSDLNSPFPFRGKGFRVAGLIDRQANKIAVSNSISPQVMRFTAAHEIGHWILHPAEVLHRDLPIDNHAEVVAQSLEEREANCFAACYLMPERLLRSEFEQHFQTQLFHFNENTAYWLSPSAANNLIWSGRDSLDRAFALATNKLYNGRHMHSLAERFQVSNSAMAVRIHELELIKWP